MNMHTLTPLAAHIATTITALLIGGGLPVSDAMSSIRGTTVAIGHLTVLPGMTALPQIDLPCSPDDVHGSASLCEPDLPLEQLNPDLYAERLAECECDILVSVCLRSDTFVDVINEYDAEGELRRRLTITTCEYEGCEAEVELLDIHVPS